ncbi:hypothetical protein BJ322DRAFT_178519 [Thelephora terrestris]|uniref:Uncharacterized protein n=1 Tax=Thelephora terrestris TaxID=56493 RepID=A0A9P6L4Z6_9AGAM|nr:hypothetical protein BJ322DRAFT_178519 [Thelephora terrestris]
MYITLHKRKGVRWTRGPAPCAVTIWLLENYTDPSAATTVAAVFFEFQWPAHIHSATALIRFRDAYTRCLHAPKLDEPTRLQALQLAAAYYVLYHSWLLRSTSKCWEAEELPAHLPKDLLLHSEECHDPDTFEYLLRIEDRSAPVTSAEFLSYIAPYWFCGDSDSAIKFRSVRMLVLDELITVLESSKALNPATLTNLVLCVGAGMDFPLHPEDLIRVDKREVVEHIHKIVLAGSRRRRYAPQTIHLLKPHG